MWVLQLFYHGDVIEFDVEVLIDRFQGSTDLDVVLELDGNLVVHQSLEEAIRPQRVSIGAILTDSESSRGVNT